MNKLFNWLYQKEQRSPNNAIGTITIEVTTEGQQIKSAHKIDGDLEGTLAGQILIDVGRDILLTLAHNH